MLEAVEGVPVGGEDWASMGAQSGLMLEKAWFADLLFGFFTYLYAPSFDGEGMRRALQHPWFTHIQSTMS